MNLFSSIKLFCGIGEDATRILHKRIGKVKGLQTIEDQIRNTATRAAEESFGDKLDRVGKIHVDRYVDQRMVYMRNAFKKLNNPQTNVSRERGEFIGDTEQKSAHDWGRAKGFERLAKTSKRTILKSWIDNDGCEVCSGNADEGPIPVGQEFQSGHFAPQCHPNCTCVLRYEDDKGNEIEGPDYDEE